MNRDAIRRRHKRVGAKREKGDALVIKTEQSVLGQNRTYSDVMKAMQSDTKLVDLGADVRSFRCTRTREMFLELKRDKGAAYKSLAEEVLGKGVAVRALTARDAR